VRYDGIPSRSGCQTAPKCSRRELITCAIKFFNYSYLIALAVSWIIRRSRVRVSGVVRRGDRLVYLKTIGVGRLDGKMKTMTHECPCTSKFVFFTHLMHLLRPPGMLEEAFETPHPFSPSPRTPLLIIALPRRIWSSFRIRSCATWPRDLITRPASNYTNNNDDECKIGAGDRGAYPSRVAGHSSGVCCDTWEIKRNGGEGRK